MKKLKDKAPIPPVSVNAAMVMVMTAILIVVNMIGVVAVDKFSLKLDMTDNKLYEFSDTTYQVVESLKEPVNITVFNSESDFVIMLREVLKRYDSLSNKITVSYKDPYENPVLVDSFKQRGIDIKQNDIVIEGKNRVKKYEIDDMYIFNSAKTSVTGMKAEQQITSSLIYVNDTRVPVAKFTDGHNERPTTALMKLFEQNNFKVDRVTINIMGISEDTDMLVIASPTRDFEQNEINKLNEYMNRGGRLMVFVEPSASEFANLKGFLSKWGIGLGREVVFEKKAYVSNNPINIVPMYAQHEINMYFGGNRYFLVMPSSRSLHKVDNASHDLDVMIALVSSPESYGKSGVDFKTTGQEKNDAKGPFYLAMTSSRQVSAKGRQDDARMFVAGSRSMFGDDILGVSSYANGDFLIQTMNWLNKNQKSINIPAKNISPDPINVLPGEAVIIGIILIGLIPLGIFIFGIIVYFRRKNL